MKTHKTGTRWVGIITVIMVCVCLALACPTAVFAQDETPPQPTDAPLTVEQDLQPTEAVSEQLPEEQPVELVPEPAQEIVLVEDPDTLTGGDPSGVLGSVAGLQCDNGVPLVGWSFSFFLSDGLHLNGTCHIVGASVQAWWDAPIQNAIDYAAVGSTVSISGEFTEAFHIYKALTIQGVGDPIIHSPATIPASNFYMADTSSYYPIILVSDTDGVTIQGLQVAGDIMGDTNYRFVGILFGDASGSIIGNTITGVRDSLMTANPSGVAIFVYNTGIDPQTVNITGNTVEDFQRVGIAVEGSNLIANVSGNTITGASPILTTTQNGIQFTNGARGTISNNTISDMYYLLTSDGSSAIAGSALQGNVVISNNTLENNQIGIYLAEVMNSEVTGNTISGGQVGMLFVNSMGTRVNVALSNNTITGNDYGVYSDNHLLAVNNNNIYGNLAGLTLNSQVPEVIMDATLNYWGCSTGPNTGACDLVYGSAMYIPFLVGPLGSPENNLPFPTFFQPTTSTIEPLIVVPVEVAVSSGQVVDLSCTSANRLTLPDGTSTLFTSILCGYSASLTPQTNSLTITITQNGVPVDILPGGATAIISFAIPQDMQAPFSILYKDMTLNGGAGDWVVLPATPGLLREGDVRAVMQGVTQIGNFVQVQVNFTGTFVLVSQ